MSDQIEGFVVTINEPEVMPEGKVTLDYMVAACNCEAAIEKWKTGVREHWKKHFPHMENVWEWAGEEADDVREWHYAVNKYKIHRVRTTVGI